MPKEVFNMVEVISLLSSPPTSPRLPLWASPRTSLKNRSDEVFNLCSDDFSSTGDLSFVLSSSSKRRKLDRLTSNNVSHLGPSSRATSLQPTSGNYGMPAAGAMIMSQFKVTKSTECDVSDPIMFSSSAPEPKTKKKARLPTNLELSDDLPDDIFCGLAPSASQQAATSTSRQQLSERTANLLAEIRRDLGGGSGSKAAAKGANRFRFSGLSTAGAPAGAPAVEDIFDSSPPNAEAVKASKFKLSEEGKAARPAECARVKTGSKVDKLAEKERKRLEKEAKAREKQRADDIAEVNKKKTDKNVSAKEMIVDMSRGFQGLSAGNQLEDYMKELEVELNYVDEEIDLSTMNDSEFAYPGNIVKWRRRVTARYNEEESQWEPITNPKIEQEKHILIYLTAVEFATIAAQSATSNPLPPVDEAAMKANIHRHMTHIHSIAKDSKPIYLIEGLEAWLRKNATAKNRAYTAAVRAQDDPSSQAPSSSQRPKKRKKAALPALDLSHIDFDLAERLQLHLQLHPLRPLVHLTTSATSTAAWIKAFTEHISTIPYRRLKLSDNLSSASFCMDSGQVKTGENAQDTYVKMLQEVQRVTPSMAYGIAAKYGDVKTLVEKFKQDGPLMLEDVKKSTNKDGALSDRRLGPQVSRRLYKVFTGRDEQSMDGIA